MRDIDTLQRRVLQINNELEKMDTAQTVLKEQSIFLEIERDTLHWVLGSRKHPCNVLVDPSPPEPNSE